MSAAASQAQKFYEQVVRDRTVFTVVEAAGLLVFSIRGHEVVPFWSSASRLARIRKTHPKYNRYETRELSLDDFLNSTLKKLEKEQIYVGVNWSGARLVGYDVSPADIVKNIEYWEARREIG